MAIIAVMQPQQLGMGDTQQTAGDTRGAGSKTSVLPACCPSSWVHL